jgi:TRAP-type C4-dicarboxylate transport system permease small subunit
MNSPKKIGLGLLALGFIILIGYGLYEAGTELWSDPAVPLLIKIGSAALVIGFVVIVFALIAERLKDNKDDNKSYDHEHNL